MTADSESRGETGWEELRGFLSRLEEAGELERYTEPVSIRHVAKIIEETDRAVLVEDVAGYEIPVLANIMANRRCWSLAFGVDEDHLIRELGSRMEQRIPPVRIDGASVRDVVQIGDDVDLGELPIYLQHELDGGPYISAALDISKHPESGRYNIGVRRLMVRGRSETGVDVVAPSDLRAYYRRARELGRPLEVAFAVGLHPLDYMATQMHVAVDDEYETMGGMRGQPVTLVPCETVDLEVPADAEIVLEGYIHGDWDEVEGPFGEYHGAIGGSHLNPVFQVTAVTRRRDARFYSATIGGKKLHHTDTAVITALRTELIVWEAVSRAVAGDVRVYCPPAATGLHQARVSIGVRDPGDGKNAAAAALASYGEIKQVIVVDDDIDIFDDNDVEWAVATRFQADRDCMILSGLRTFPLDPSLPPHEGPNVTTSKMGMDATCRYDRPRESFDRPPPPFDSEPVGSITEDGRSVDAEALAQELLPVMGERPRFADLLATFRDVRQRDLVAAVQLLRERGEIQMDRDGRYQVVP